MGAAASVEARLTESSLDNAHFPAHINLFFNPWNVRSKYRLSEKSWSSPSHVARIRRLGVGDIILYNGPTTHSPPLAIVKKGTSEVVVSLPPKMPGQARREESLSVSKTMPYAVAYFSIEVDGAQNPERFEWRRANAEEVKELGNISHGYKLVRVDGGDEVVAVWANVAPKSTTSPNASLRFIARGATGELGPVFAVMTVSSFIRQFQLGPVALMPERETGSKQGVDNRTIFKSVGKQISSSRGTRRPHSGSGFHGGVTAGASAGTFAGAIGSVAGASSGGGCGGGAAGAC